MSRSQLALDDLRTILAPFDLRPLHVERLDKGTVNSNFRVDSNGGRLFVRVNEGKRETDVRYEGALLWHLGARRFPTPQPLRTGTGEPFVRYLGKLVTVFPWWPGREIDAGEMTAERAGRVGDVLARLHLAAADFEKAHGRREGIYTFERIAARVEAFRARGADVPEIAEVLPVLDEEIGFLRGARPALAPLPSGTIHGDLFPDNLLWARPPAGARRGGDGGEDVSAAIDFEQASAGRFVYDLAVTLLAFCFSGGPPASPASAASPASMDAALAWALTAGYQRVRPLSDEEREGLWIEARTAALRFTVTRITDVFLPSLPPSSLPARPGKDFRDYLARLLYLREAGREAVGLATDERPPLRAV